MVNGKLPKNREMKTTLVQRIKDIFTGNASKIKQLEETNVSIKKENARLSKKVSSLKEELSEIAETVDSYEA